MVVCGSQIAPLLAGGLAVVSRHHGPDDRPGAGGPTGNGRPLCLSAAAGSFSSWFAGASRTSRRRGAFPSVLLPALSSVVIVALALIAHRQIGYWADNITLWTHTIEITAPNYIAQDDLGGALMSQNRLEEAIVHFREAAAIHPVDPISTFNIGFYEQRHGDLEQAIEQYKKAIILTTSPSFEDPGVEQHGIRLSRPGQFRTGTRVLRGCEEIAGALNLISSGIVRLCADLPVSEKSDMTSVDLTPAQQSLAAVRSPVITSRSRCSC